MACAVAAAWLGLVLPRAAHASLGDDGARVAAALTERGGKVVQRHVVFLEEGRVATVVGPRTGAAFCKTIVLLGARTSVFVAVSGRGDADQDGLARMLVAVDGEGREESREGLAILSACGDEASELSRVVLRMVSQRGAIEVIVAISPGPLGTLEKIVPRDVGPVAPRGDPGPPLASAPLVDRRRRAMERARADGAMNILPVEMKAGARGRGDFVLKVPMGCHRFDVLADLPEPDGGPMFPTDVDVELRASDDAVVIARDRGETPDARVEACVAETTELTLAFMGAPPGVRVQIIDAIWPLPKGISGRWGPRARAGLASAVRRRTTRVPDRPPIAEALGAQGATEVPIRVEPGRCYVASVALMRGTSRGLRVSATASSRTSTEEVPGPGEASAVVFCAESEAGRVNIEVPGASIGWVLGVWLLEPRSTSPVAEGPPRGGAP